MTYECSACGTSLNREVYFLDAEECEPKEAGNYLVFLKVGSISTKVVTTIRRYHKREHNSQWMEGDWEKVLQWAELPEYVKDEV